MHACLVIFRPVSRVDVAAGEAEADHEAVTTAAPAETSETAPVTAPTAAGGAGGTNTVGVTGTDTSGVTDTNAGGKTDPDTGGVTGTPRRAAISSAVSHSGGSEDCVICPCMAVSARCVRSIGRSEK